MIIYSSDRYKYEMQCKAVAMVANLAASVIFVDTAARRAPEYAALGYAVALIFLVLSLFNLVNVFLYARKMREERHRFAEYSDRTSTKMNYQGHCPLSRCYKVSVVGKNHSQAVLRSQLGFKMRSADFARERLHDEFMGGRS